MTIAHPGYVWAEKRVDDNGNWYWVNLSGHPWATEGLAESDAKYRGLGLGEVVLADQERMLDN